MSTSPSHGDLVDRFEVGSVTVWVRHSCIRRDLYDLRVRAPLSASTLARLRAAGQVRADGSALVVVDVPRVHRLTIAPALGRVVAMPKLETERPQQRDAAEALARLLSELD